ncbi:hypothetical protein IC229_32625 [Spirosoma sp. BT702]|uniref:Uncharacterized protein n=1 Tax=Spirosoma profusum TaxID=2771354 RepID=A0A927AVY8_9BACT|nr:hypothetical protein [Spirosoma profusum]MBD2705404.1 hypothetical protein [Spirosoma profusum]
MNVEEEPSKEFVKGYNHGCQLAKHEPELLDKLLQAQSGNTPNDYSRAMVQGKNQYEHEKLVAEMKAIRERQKQTIKRKR